MLNTAVKKLQRAQMNQLVAAQLRMFSHGPYNPLNYKHLLLPEELPR